jgi:hypothetical protein
MTDAADGRTDAPTDTRLARLLPWVARLAWVLVAVVGGGALEGAVDGRSGAVRWTVAVLGWTLWAAVALGLVIAATATLGLVRVLSPLSLLAAGTAAIAGSAATDVAVLVVPAMLAVSAVFTAEFGRAWAQASAYGDEERFPLRPPAAAGAAAAVTWVVWAAAAFAGPLLVAARVWIVGGLLSALAVAGAAFLAPRWMRLAGRWLVLVPAGLVVRDPIVLGETLMLRRADIAAIGLAPADTEAADLTGPASGYVLQVTTTGTTTAVFAPTPSEPNGRAIHLLSFLVAPSRPGAALGAAHRRGLPVAAAQSAG